MPAPAHAIRPDFSATQFTPYQSDALPMPDGDLWVFGYGSLMWNPGFAVEKAVAARLYGYHRRLCLWSIHYRGTATHPGLVLGLDRGGSCNGMALRVAHADIPTASAYLLKREMINNAYLPIIKKIYLAHGGGDGGVEALTFISKQQHPQFAQPMSIAETVAVVRTATGKHGENCDYVLNTVRHLNEFEIKRTTLHAVAARLQ